MLETVLFISLIILSISIFACLYRVIKGPSMPDRVIALDSIGIHIIGFVGILSIMFNTHAYMEVILLIGILAFIGTISFSKFLERGVVIEHKRNN
ncbi:Na(+)/H(+) antiporter subunit F1 [Caldalkalibacillus mannanilyticus]|uniref:Na(+)/H(+) antiporter subunit F1 n=1 Tax=Caldalkalibacillus mannanilyticus TaxID=1418 RepID=UPI00046A9B7A|nr:Na(+)/H(+) antiporter subunit F1 [Caldalkalibacillus mannanilyticus]